nr:hypothetical protein BHI3_03170 [Bacteriovorax sp. HI3]
MFARKVYRNIFIVTDRSYEEDFLHLYDSQHDLVLTFDFAVHKKIKEQKGEVHFLDHLLDPQVVESENINIYRYFKKWHLDKNGRDIFNYNGLDFGFVFRQEIWNDFTYSIRLLINLRVLKTVECQRLYVGTDDQVLLQILSLQNLSFTKIEMIQNSEMTYFFPMSKWMNQAIRPSGLKAKLRNAFYFIVPWVMFYLHKLNPFLEQKPLVFVQNYHPTKPILQKLASDNKVRLCLERYSDYGNWKGYFQERTIPLFTLKKRHTKEAERLWNKFRNEKHERIVLLDGSDITDFILLFFEKRLKTNIVSYLKYIDSVKFYFSHYPPQLEILVGNVGIFSGIVHAYFTQNKIANYLIINGFLGDDFGDESKYALTINSYSEAIKKNYYHGQDNIVVLGDPRMDQYFLMPRREINREQTVVSIGTSAFNNVDLNSYSSEEFCFLSDILTVLQDKKNNGKNIEIIIKVRPNGYKSQYVSFLQEYFPSLEVTILDSVPMLKVLQKTDFYISFYSQTLFEASMLGVPVIFYKKDTMVMHPPFDGKGELVTAKNQEELSAAFEDFYLDSERYNKFLDRKVMEYYQGPLDGNNVQRNIDYIYKLLNCSNEAQVLELAAKVSACSDC